MFSCVAVFDIAIAAVLLGSSLQCQEDGPSIELSKLEGKDVIVVSRIPEDALDKLASLQKGDDGLSSVLQVFVNGKSDSGQPPVLGRVRVLDESLLFEPRFALKRGLAYRVVYRPLSTTRQAETVDEQPLVESVVRLEPRDKGPPTVVEAVYPSGDVLPENLLKFYVHFSSPMSQGHVYSHVHLLTENGDEIEYPFVNVGQELWDRSGRRVTLLLDPGRIKRGLRPREELGPILQEGMSYELVIDEKWLDASGRPLKTPYRKRFAAAAPDDRQPDPSQWKLDAPELGTSAPLSITFSEPLDHALLLSGIAILNEHKSPVAGRIQVAAAETRWHFFPDDEWVAGDYTVEVDTALEDRAGNSIERPFEVDVFDKVEARIPHRRTTIPFRVRGE